MKRPVRRGVSAEFECTNRKLLRDDLLAGPAVRPGFFEELHVAVCEVGAVVSVEDEHAGRFRDVGGRPRSGEGGFAGAEERPVLNDDLVSPKESARVRM